MQLLYIPVEPQPSHWLQAKISYYFFKYENNTKKGAMLAGGLFQQREKVHERSLGL